MLFIAGGHFDTGCDNRYPVIVYVCYKATFNNDNAVTIMLDQCYWKGGWA